MTENEREQVRGRVGDPTTMRLPGIGAPAEPVTDADPSLSAQDQATVDALVHGTALLVVLRGPNTGARFLLDADEVTTGRHPDSDIFLDDVTVSRRHAVLVERDGRWFVEDQGSLNGTFVNRARVESSELSDGDELQIGKYRLTFLSR
jgi:pSer/pThr/pTyr-binding forkhead associated (FHA) protein